MRHAGKGLGGDGIVLRLFLTVWLLYSVHLTTNVVRETYLAVALGGSGTVRVDKYLGLHPDLFEIPGRGAYINSNPGASIIGAAAYALVHPLIAVAVRLKPGIAEAKPPASYDDPRPNRTRFMNEARARGLDIVLGLAALGIGFVLMAPLGALAAVLVYRALESRLEDRRAALGWALVYAFATPIFFRSAFLNHNAILAHCVLGAWLALTGLRQNATQRERGIDPSTPFRRFVLAGMLLGIGLLNDYSAIPLMLTFGIWVLVSGWRAGGMPTGLSWAAGLVAGAAVPIIILIWYQWVAFGNPWLPAQRYMPPTEFSVRGWFGLSVPTLDLLWRNLFDHRYGLLAFCPLLAAAFAAPFLRVRRGGPSNSELICIFASVAGLYVFSSANQFANLQWNTGVRYMVPATPLLFFAAIPVLRAMPLFARASLVGVSLVISAAVSMTREDVLTALEMVMQGGPTLPMLIVIRKMQSGYGGIALPSYAIWAIYAVIAFMLWILWRHTGRDLARVGRAETVER